jgi:hypothetical protein
MKGRATALIPAALAATIVALTLYAYRELPARPFAADDYQWLLHVRGLSLGEVARKAFDPSAQSHFYRPLVWLLFWAQTRVFGLDPRGFHAVSLGLHLLNAFLLGWLFYRLTGDEGRRTKDETRHPWSFVFRLSSIILITGIVALHPAPFEAVVWVSAQSELLAAALLLAALLLWTTDDGRRTTDDGFRHSIVYRLSSIVGGWSALLATLALGLALLAKESAVIGLPLLILLGREPHIRSQESGVRSQESESRITHHISRITHHASLIAPYLLPTLITLGYVALQVAIERRNYLLEQGGYGLGPQLVLNPLRSLALLVAPLSGSEHADAAWLVPVGAAVALVLLALLISDWRSGIGRRLEQWSVVGYRPSVGLILALGLTLLPTAPFASPPDSRYLYLPLLAAALLIGWTMDDGRWTMEPMPERVYRLSSIVYRRGIVLCSLFFVLALAWWSSGELHAREGRFAAASGPGGSLWRVAKAVCAESRPERMVIVDPPLAPPHAEAIVGLACGDATRAKIVGRDQVAKAIKGHSVVIAFPNGSAEIEQRT